MSRGINLRGMYLRILARALISTACKFVLSYIFFCMFYTVDIYILTLQQRAREQTEGYHPRCISEAWKHDIFVSSYIPDLIMIDI